MAAAGVLAVDLLQTGLVDVMLEDLANPVLGIGGIPPSSRVK